MEWIQDRRESGMWFGLLSLRYTWHMQAEMIVGTEDTILEVKGVGKRCEIDN